ncbi:Multidrug resistance protein MdtE [Usitatibacter rugosus]|uniref:Multidrug resistance protein MdtE n=1 Tax=Usitatibacter rugosus TaxID=2732067 RepID=A0A6M4GTA0_9PROT|nr:efflux RND transporter periplasmic adaptor subunit [Usitatibacter rugosus]QJR09523.1 Multidrug resistance protein MdtE [Usitatibacter rugosus]
MSPRIALALVAALTVAACTKGPAAPQKGAEAPALLLSAEDTVTVRNTALASGPSITGSIQPERRADLRAEVQAIVLQVMRENGDVVKRGDPLVRLDDTSIRDLLASAESAARAADLAYDQAQRQLERMKTLRTSGMTSAQAMEDSEIRRNTTQSEVEAAKARVVQARQQLERTVVRAPFDGVVSDRKVSAGDTAQMGKELLKVIDPTSMRFEGMVSADQIGDVKAGQAASFRVNGYGNEEFSGKVRRVNPAANATTRQVEVLVDFTGQKQPRLAGLYAEGRVEAASTTGLTIPATSIVRDGDKASAWRVKDSKLQKAQIALGDRDPRTGDYAVKTGLTEGDKVIRYPTALLKDGQLVQGPGSPTTENTATNTPPSAAAATSTAKGS